RVAYVLRKVLLEPSGDDHAGCGRLQCASILLDVPAVLDGLHDRRVGRGPADAALLKLFDETRFGIAIRRLSLLLLALKREKLQRLPFLYLRELRVFAASLGIKREPAGEDDAGAVCGERRNICIRDRLNLRAKDARRSHLRSNSSRTDEIV